MGDEHEISTLRQQHMYDSQSGFDTVDENHDWEAASNMGADEVLLNISPNKFEKPKDQLFIDFFSMYTKKFVDEQTQYKEAQKVN